MKFQYHNPSRFVFGEDAFDQLPELCRGKRVLLVYGGGSIKENGVYSQIIELLQSCGAVLVDFGGHTAAAYPAILDGIALAPEDFGEFTPEEMRRMIAACYM